MMLRTENLSVVLPGGLRALSGIDLGIARGEAVGLVGESGSGKSMAALALIGLLPPSARVTGRVMLDGRDLLSLDEAQWCALRGARIAMVFQEPMTALDPVMRVVDQVAEAWRAHERLRAPDARARAAALLEQVGIATPRAFPHQLSGGQRQRVMIAAALAAAPDLLIADEPTTALDVTVQARILDLLAGLCVARSMAMLLITHDIGIVEQVASRVLVMYAGRVVEEGPTDAVIARRAHPYTRGLVAASPHGEHGGRPVAIPGQMPDPRLLPPGCAFAPRCPRADHVCQTRVPPLADVGGHLAACWHPHA